MFDEITHILVERYENNIKAILAYGSRVTNECAVDKYSDYDLTIVFKEYPKFPFPNFPPGADITMVFECELSDDSLSAFNLDGHGSFYLHTLANANCIYGKNPFVRYLRNTPIAEINKSLAEQINSHAWKLQKIALSETGYFRRRQIRKYSFRLAQNYYFLMGSMDYGIFHNEPYDNWIKIFLRQSKYPRDFIDYLELLLCSEEPLLEEVLNYCGRLKSTTINYL